MDEFNRAETFLGLQGLMAAAAPPDFAEVEEDHRGLVTALASFDRGECLALGAALLTFPQFHANTIRVELLQNFIHRNARGPHHPTRSRFAQWLNQHLGPGYAGRLEDPVEDVFISNVVSSIGNSRVFEGIWEANDFWLQQALNAVRTLRDEAWAAELIEECFALLSVSEELAQRCGLARYTMGGGSVRNALDLPAQADLRARAELTRFSRRALDDLGVTFDRLAPFIHDDAIAEGALGKSSLERRPLVRDRDGILVALPAAISPAIRLHVVATLIRAGTVETFERALFSQQLGELLNEGVSALGGKLVEQHGLPALPADTPAKVQELVEFDRGTFAHIVFCEDPVLQFLETGMGGILDLAGSAEGGLPLHCQQCARQVAAQPGYSGGLTILIVGGLGRAFTYAGRELPDHWHLTSFRLPDFFALGRVPRADLLQIWKLEQQEDSLRERGVRIMNMNGELNLLGFWQHQGQRLLPRDGRPSGMMIHVGTDFIAKVRRDLRSTHDAHAVMRRNPDVWASIRRYNVQPFFKEAAHDPIYADERDAGRGRLRGIIETAQRPWWLSSLQRLRSGWHRDMQFRIWDALLQWLVKIAPLVEAEVPALPAGPIEVFLQFRGFEQWTTQRLDDLPEAQEPTVAINRRLGAVQIILPLGFLRHFATPANVAERKLIDACLAGVGALGGVRLATERLNALVQRIVRNDEARFFHIAFAQSYRQHVGSEERVKPRFINEGDINFACVGLAQRVLDDPEPKPVEGADACNRFLHKVVDDCWQRLCALLENFERCSVVARALRNVEAIECDKDQWAMTAGALLATHDDREDVMAAARDRDADCASASLASRIIVEMAVCTCPAAGGAAIGEADFDTLLALVRLLLYAANASDAVRFELTPAKVGIAPNGEFFVDDAYMEAVIRPYMTEHFSGQFTAAAESYDDYYRDPAAPRPNTEDAPLPPAFAEAFQAEYGYSPDDLIAAQLALERDALRDSRLVVERTEKQIREVLAAADLAAEVADRLLENFALWPRGAWDNTPRGFTMKDWFPWRYRRRLSLLARPLVRLGKDGDSIVIFAPGVVRDGVELLLVRLLSGRFPAEDFHSAAMRSWIGEVTRQRGDEFEELVAKEARAAGLEALVNRPMTEFGADQSYGDIDVLAWSPSGEVIHAIECKRLRLARTNAEIGEQLREFQGQELDRLARHLRRCQWLAANPGALRRVTKTRHTQPRLVPLLVTSTIVPMQFTQGLPLPPDHIIPLARLRSWLTS